MIHFFKELVVQKSKKKLNYFSLTLLYLGIISYITCTYITVVVVAQRQNV